MPVDLSYRLEGEGVKRAEYRSLATRVLWPMARSLRSLYGKLFLCHKLYAIERTK